MGYSNFDGNRDPARLNSNIDKGMFAGTLIHNGEPFCIKSHVQYKIAGRPGLCFGLKDAIDAIRGGIFDWFPASVYAGMITPCIFLLIFPRSFVYIDKQSILIVRAFGRHKIKWNEMEKIIIDNKLRRLIFHGDNKWRVMPGITPLHLAEDLV